MFHYTSAETALDAILTNGSLRLGPPIGLNDPFESEPLWPSYSADAGASLEVFDAGTMVALSAEVSELMRDRCRLACLSRSGPWESSGPLGFGDGYARARMWAQYAGAHAGVCLAFDQQRLRSMFRHQFGNRGEVRPYDAPVRYRPNSESWRGIHLRLREVRENPRDHLERLFPSLASVMCFTKAWDWSTETEYRLLVHGDVHEHEYVDITDALTDVFLGPRFPNQRARDIKARCRAIWDAGRVFQILWRGSTPVALPVSDGHVANGPTWRIPDRPLDLDPPLPGQVEKGPERPEET